MRTRLGVVALLSAGALATCVQVRAHGWSTHAFFVSCAPQTVPSDWELAGNPPTPPPPSLDPPSEPPPGPAPTYGPTRHLDEAPPALSGGSLLVTRSGAYAIAGDPDRDRVFVVALASQAVRGLVVPARSEPGRAAEDAAGIVHVVLRKTGEVLSLDPRTAVVLGRRFACRGARGIAYEGEVGQLLVTCANGDLMAVPTAIEGAPALLSHLEADLRDVVVSGGRIFVSTFRSARVFEVSKTGAIVKPFETTSPAIHDARHPARVAWRMIAPLTGAAEPLVVHQLASVEPVSTSSTPTPNGAVGYGGAPLGEPACGENAGPVVVTSLTRLGQNGPVRFTNGFASLPIDVATDGEEITVVAAGNGHTPERPQLFTYPSSFSSATRPQRDPRFRGMAGISGCTVQVSGSSDDVGQLTSVAYAGKGHLVLLSREPAQLVRWPERIVIGLSVESREDTGHAIFHSNAGADVACASCHAEGADDGHTWFFDRFGARRTPSLLGTLEGTAPYHWSGDMDGLSTLADEVFTTRMRGPRLDGRQKTVLQQWLFALPPPQATPSKGADAIARGKALFESAGVGCASCHAGAKLASPASADVGTGGVFQVPSLVGVGARAPYLHDGCARTLHERFGRCGSDMHGKTSQLSGADIDDLVAYLESL
ncbi:MAG: c-type cytochrome [Deltaproteobacteria bacterium]|nr:c-type cytochrome [Deltaproteobacteria bacterium]